MYNRIKNIGDYHEIDIDGYIKNPCNYPLKQKEYQESIDFFLSLIFYIRKIDSIYLRGSIAKGFGVHFISDIDLIIILKSNLLLIEKQNIQNTAREILENFKFISKLDLHFIYLEDLKKPIYQFILMTQSICIYGENYTNKFKNFKIGTEAYFHVFSFEKHINYTLSEIDQIADIEEIKSTCSWCMKQILRTGFEIVMLKENKYTRDLYPCYLSFSTHYPNKKNLMKKALRLAVFPVSDKNEILKTINSLVPFLINEIKSNNIINTNN